MGSRLQSWLSFYDYLTLHIVPGPRSWMYFIPFVGTFAALMTPLTLLSPRSLRLLVLPLLVAIQIADWYLHQSFDVISTNHVLSMFMLLGYYNVRGDFKRVVRDADHEQKYSLERHPESIKSRLKWVGTLLVSLRLTDFHIGLASHDRRQPAPIQPLGSFFLHSVIQAIFSYALLWYTRGNDFCKAGSDPAFLAKLYALLSLYNGLLPTILVLCILVPLKLQHNSMVSPLTWYGHFGPLGSIYGMHSAFGLRAFWGVFWHQNMRFLTSAPGLAISSLIGIKGTQRYILVVSASFLLSGVVHMGVIPAEPVNGSALMLRLRLASFFWAQPIGIAIETLLHDFFKDKLIARDVKHIATFEQLQYLFWRGIILLWTCGFLVMTAGQTIRPVGCTMGWWSSPWLS